jgi:hypothetical protein
MNAKREGKMKYTHIVKDFKWKGAAPWLLEFVIVPGNKVHTPEINIVFGEGRLILWNRRTYYLHRFRESRSLFPSKGKNGQHSVDGWNLAGY